MSKKKDSRQVYINIIKLIISAALLVILFQKIDMQKFVKEIREIPLRIFAAALLLYIVSIFLNAWKWKQLAIDVPFESLLSASFKAQFYSTVLPGQMFGEVSKVVSLHNISKNTIELTTSVMADKLLSLIDILIIGIIGGLLTDLPLGNSLCVVYAVACILLCLILYIPRIKKADIFLRKILDGSFSIFKRAYYAWRVYSSMKGRLILAFWIGTLSQLLGAIEIAWIAQYMELHIAFFDYMWMTTGMSFLLLLPVSFGGIGIRDVSLVGMLGLFSVSKDKALLISAVIFSAQICSAIIGGIFVMVDSIKGNER